MEEVKLGTSKESVEPFLNSVMCLIQTIE